MSMDSLYTELIMMHNKSGHNRHVLEHANHAERGHNPSCGDDLTLQVQLQDDIIVDAAFLGSGCAISQASISIMIDLVKGKSIKTAKDLVGNYLNMIRGVSLTETQLEGLEDAQVFIGLSKMPARVKCGTLGWHCLDVILEKSSK